MRARSFSILPTSLLLTTALLGACSVDPASEGTSEPVAETRQALNGSWVHVPILGQVPCSADELDIIQDAFDILQDEILDDPGAFQACMKNAVFSYDYGHSVETLISILEDQQTTLMHCVDMPSFIGKNANACELYTGESIAMNHAFLADQIATWDAREVATVILHEVIHDRGIHHADGSAGFAQSINEQAQNCLRDGDISGSRRSEWLKEAELAQIGGDAGEPFGVRSCETDHFLIGQSIAVNAAGNDLAGFRMRCADALGNNLHFRFVGDMTSPTLNDCGPGEIVVGVTGNADTNGVHKMGLHCAPTLGVLTGNNTVSRVLPEVGVATGPRFKRFCPAGMAVKGILGRSSASSVEQLRLVCDDFVGWDLGEPFTGAGLGVAMGASPFTTYELCSDRGVATRLLGTDDPTIVELLLAAIVGMVIPCLRFRTGAGLTVGVVRTHARRGGEWYAAPERSGSLGSAVLALTTRQSAFETHITPLGGAIPGPGGSPGVAFADVSCPADTALVGVRTWPALLGGIAAIEGICRSTASWANGVASQVYDVHDARRVPLATGVDRATASTSGVPAGPRVLVGSWRTARAATETSEAELRVSSRQQGRRRRSGRPDRAARSSRARPMSATPSVRVRVDRRGARPRRGPAVFDTDDATGREDGRGTARAGSSRSLPTVGAEAEAAGSL